MLRYNIEVHTGDEQGTETDANVFLQIIGSRGDSGKRELYQSNKRKKFRAAQVDEFNIEAVDLDEIEQIVVGHDSKKKGAGWFLEKIIIKSFEIKPKDPKTSRRDSKAQKGRGGKPEKEEAEETPLKTWYFDVKKWFDKGFDDKEIVRTLHPSVPPEDKKGLY